MAASLPTSFPIFPLPDCVLFPELEMGFHIFEPRYRAMTRFVLGGDGVIGMMLIRSGEDPLAARAGVFEVGCAARVVRSFKLSGGRFKLMLAGARRFRILEEEMHEAGFRLAHVELLKDPRFEELSPGLRRRVEGLGDAVRDALFRLTGSARESGVRTLDDRLAPLDPIQRIHTIASWLMGPAVERQGLLEAPDVEQRAELLREMLELHWVERSGSFAGGPVH